MSDEIENLEATIDIDATPAAVWDLITDLPAMSKRSPQVMKTKVFGKHAQLGSRFVNVNTNGKLIWPTTGKIVRFDAHNDFAFRIAENGVTWAFALTETGNGGCKLVHRRETPDGISGVSKLMTKTLLGGQEKFSGEMKRGMMQNLQAIKHQAEVK